MLEVNKTLNLTAIKDEDGVILKHLVDSSAVIPFIKFFVASFLLATEISFSVNI